MATVLRELDLREDREVLCGFLQANMGPRCTRERFEWLFLENPHGEGRAWGVFEEAAPRPVGVAAAVPREFVLAGEAAMGWQLADFAIERARRTLGPAVALQRACLEAIGGLEDPFCFDLPSRTMAAVYRRLGVVAPATIVRLARPLRVDRKVRDVLKSEPWAKIASAAGNLVLRLASRGRLPGDLELSLGAPRFGEEFTGLWEQLRGRLQVAGVRTAEYLEWRYRRSPLDRFELATLRRDGELIAFGVVRLEGEDAVLLECLAREEGLVPPFLSGILEALREKRIVTVSFPALQSSALDRLAREAGFRERESTAFVVYAHPEWSRAAAVADPKEWFFTYGDGEL